MNAQNAGAEAVIVYDNVYEALIIMGQAHRQPGPRHTLRVRVPEGRNCDAQDDRHR